MLLVRPTHGDLSGLGGKLERPLTSPDNRCAIWDGDHSTDRGLSGHSWLLPNRWETRPSLTITGDTELPAPGPDLRTKVSSTCLGLAHTVERPWSCEVDFPSGKIPWSWATTAGVSCTAGQMVSHWTQLPSDPAISETAWQWVTGLLSLSWLTWKSTRSEQETFVPASWSNSTPRLNKWSSEPEKAHFLWRLVSTPTVSYERGWHLDVSPPPSPTELESASRRYNLVSDALQPQWS